jgi:Group XII secretory phospholipase A2 precursor (PLA2G12)
MSTKENNQTISTESKLEPLFDRLSKIYASNYSRRDAFRIATATIVTPILASLGVKSAKAATSCLCGGNPLLSGWACCPYDDQGNLVPTAYYPQIYCCTSKLTPKHPIEDLNACPNKQSTVGYAPVPNECGAEGTSTFIVNWLNNGYSGVKFTSCCNEHDKCYGTCNSNKNSCDVNFKICLENRCKLYFTGRELRSCIKNANYYFGAVDKLGGSAHDAGQREACDCCFGDTPCIIAPMIIRFYVKGVLIKEFSTTDSYQEGIISDGKGSILNARYNLISEKVAKFQIYLNSETFVKRNLYGSSEGNGFHMEIFLRSDPSCTNASSILSGSIISNGTPETIYAKGQNCETIIRSQFGPSGGTYGNYTDSITARTFNGQCVAFGDTSYYLAATKTVTNLASIVTLCPYSAVDATCEAATIVNVTGSIL